MKKFDSFCGTRRLLIARHLCVTALRLRIHIFQIETPRLVASRRNMVPSPATVKRSQKGVHKRPPLVLIVRGPSAHIYLCFIVMLSVVRSVSRHSGCLCHFPHTTRRAHLVLRSLITRIRLDASYGVERVVLYNKTSST